MDFKNYFTISSNSVMLESERQFIQLFPSVPCNRSGAVREILVKNLKIPLHGIELIHNFRGGSS